MANERQVLDVLNNLGGYNCSFQIGTRGGPVFSSFIGRLATVSQEYHPDLLQIHIVQTYKSNGMYCSCYSQILLSPEHCTIDTVSGRYTFLVNHCGLQLSLTISVMANSDRELFKSYSPESPTAKKQPKKDNGSKAEAVAAVNDSDDSLRCPHCNKLCNSTSGLTLHKKQCSKTKGSESSGDSESESSGSDESLKCPHCGKLCNSTSGLTLHKQRCYKSKVLTLQSEAITGSD